MVEQPGQRLPARGPQVAKSTHTIQSRPLSADDIQKAKMRAQFMQNKHGKTNPSPDDKVKPENQNQSLVSNTTLPSSVSKSSDRGELEDPRKVENDVGKQVEEQRNAQNHVAKHVEGLRKVENDVAKHVDQPLELSLNVEEEPPWKKCKRVQIPWRIPPEVKIMESWSVGNGAESKELEVQKNRIMREREIVFRAIHEIPSDPREPWDHEMDFDDTLTPVIPIEQLPDDEPLETLVSPNDSNTIAAPIVSTSSESVAEPDLELLAELLKNPELVFALTSGQTGGLSSDATVKLLDMIKAKGVNSLGNLAGSTDSVSGNSNSRVEVSLPSPTPSTDSAPNGPKPDFTRNPFSRQQAVVNGSAYQTPGAAAFPLGGMVPSSTVLHSQISAASLPSAAAAAHQLAHKVVLPVPSLQTNVQLAENWKAPAPTNSQMHLQTSISNSFNTQYMSTETVLNTHTASNSNWASSSILSASSTAWSESLGNVKPPPPSVVKAPSRSLTPPRSSRPTKSPYPQESVARNSLSTRQGFESKYGYTNNRTLNNYNAYAGGSVEAMLPRGPRGGREYLTGRPGYESWSPDNSPSRCHEHSSSPYYHEADVNSRHGYRATTQQNVANPSRYKDHNIGSAGQKRWRDYNR